MITFSGKILRWIVMNFAWLFREIMPDRRGRRSRRINKSLKIPIHFEADKIDPGIRCRGYGPRRVAGRDFHDTGRCHVRFEKQPLGAGAEESTDK